MDERLDQPTSFTSSGVGSAAIVRNCPAMAV